MAEGDAGEEQRAQPLVAPASSSDFTVPPLAADSIPVSASAIESAQREAQGLADGNLDHIARCNNHSRREATRTVVHRLKLTFLVLISLLILAAIIIIAIHWMTPWAFLTPAQLTTLQTMLGSSLVTGVATTVGKNILKDLG